MFDFLPNEINIALSRYSFCRLQEIRLRIGQPVIIQYAGKYTILETKDKNKIVLSNVDSIFYMMINNNIPKYQEQIKKGYITLNGGIRVGIAGEYVYRNGQVQTIHHITSLNVRIPHHVDGIANKLFNFLSLEEIKSCLLISKPGGGKTTLLRDYVRAIADHYLINILIFDERDEIAAYNENQFTFSFSRCVDVIRSQNKLTSIENAIRVFQPHLIVVDEIYTNNDYDSINFALSCGIPVVATSHRLQFENIPINFNYKIIIKTFSQVDIYDQDNHVICTDFNL